VYWSWKVGGLALGIVFFLAVLLVKPIGVSTQFVIFDGIAASAIDPGLVREDASTKSGYTSTNAYLAKSGGKYAKHVAHPLNYSFVFVLAMFLGGFVAWLLSRRGGTKTLSRPIPAVHERRFGKTRLLRYALAFGGGVVSLWGARLAGGCTSGHMMSGMMQTSVSGYVFAAAAGLAGVVTATALYGRG